MMPTPKLPEASKLARAHRDHLLGGDMGDSLALLGLDVHIVEVAPHDAPERTVAFLDIRRPDVRDTVTFVGESSARSKAYVADVLALALYLRLSKKSARAWLPEPDDDMLDAIYRAEDEATVWTNAYAGELLMPAAEFTRLVAAGADAATIARFFDVPEFEVAQRAWMLAKDAS